MQCTYDRDEYVKILWENIEPHHEHNFQKYTNAQVTNFNTTYDYYSIMHYDAYGFSTNGKPTIVPMVNLDVAELLLVFLLIGLIPLFRMSRF